MSSQMVKVDILQVEKFIFYLTFTFSQISMKRDSFKVPQKFIQFIQKLFVSLRQYCGIL